MVVYSIPPSLLKRTNDRNKPYDYSTVGSTIDTSFERKQPKIDPKKLFLESYEEWHVVPSGGEKAKEKHTRQHPNPCRYDEYEEFLPKERPEKIQPIVKKKSYETNLRKRRDSKKRNESEKEYDNNEEDKTIEDTRNDTNSSNENNASNVAEKPNDTSMNNNNNTNTSNNNETNEGDANNNNNTNGRKEDNEGENEDQTFPGFDVTTMQTFTLEFDMRNTAANTVGSIHKAFIEEIFEVAPNTSFEPSNKRTTPTPKKMQTKEQFPSNHLLHQKFFHRLDIRDKVSFTHNVYSSISAIEIKRRVMPFLQEHNIGMWSEEISCNTKVRVCWILNAHNRVTNKPEIRRKTIEGINSQSKNYGDENNRLLKQLPKNMKDLAVQSRTINHKGYTTEAVCILAYRPIAPVVRELIAMLPHDYLGNKMSFVSEAAARELDSEKYTALIVANTEFHQNTRTISIKYFHEQYWKVPYKPSKLAKYAPVRDWIMAGSSVVSIERTKDTESEGRYIILCKSDGFPIFRRQLQKMVMKLKETIENDHNLKTTALEVFQQYPTIIGQHHMGKYAEKNAEGLLSRIDTPAVPRPAMKMTSNRIEFNFDSAEDFPGIKHKTSTSSRRTPTKKHTSWANAVTEKDNNSLASEPSETERTVHSNRTGITTTDQQTIQSEAISVLTEYIQASRKEDAERRKDERREDETRRKEERAERKEEKEERRRENENRKREQEETDRKNEKLRQEEREDAERRRKIESSERLKEAERRDEHNMRMFHTMMTTMMRSNNNDIGNGISFNTNYEEPPYTHNNDNTEEQNKKRKNEDNVQISTTQAMEQTRQMEIEEMTPTAQNHDVQQKENKNNQQ